METTVTDVQIIKLLNPQPLPERMANTGDVVPVMVQPGDFVKFRRVLSKDARDGLPPHENRGGAG